uniref:Disease resistance R13L4/SHOC-2-like LRR domain-containing protein n=1 Tax=Arcella intermedia TaxID=1963864 RepID=A0A6B2KYQ1_9EUKA
MVGTIPDEIGNLVNLTFLSLANNQLYGSIPRGLGKLVNLETLSLSENLLTGTLPTQLGKLSQLKFMYTAHCKLSGTIPESFSQLEQLNYLDLQDNSLTSFGHSLLRLPKLRTLKLRRNQISVDFPLFEQPKSLITSMDLSWNKLGCSMDSINFPSIEFLIITGNNCSGSFPANLQLPKLRTLEISHNQFSGEVPPLIGAESLEILDLSYNNFDGKLPDFSYLINLEQLFLRSNMFHGHLEPEYFPPYLHVLQLSDNNFTGTIPPGLGKLTRLNLVDITDVQLCGCAPPEWNSSQLELCTIGFTRPCNCPNPPPCNYVNECDETVECGVDQCADGTHQCSMRKCIPKPVAGYFCSNCNLEGYLYKRNGDYDCRFMSYVWSIPSFTALLLLVGVVGIYRENRRKEEPDSLPYYWFWNMERVKASHYKYISHSKLYYKRLGEGSSKENELFKEFIKNLDFENVKIRRIYATVSFLLASNTNNTIKIQKNRMVISQPTFMNADWKFKTDDRLVEREKTIQFFLNSCWKWEWNKNFTISNCMILPVVHGTGKKEAWQIASTGFASLSNLDPGFYGKGIYFSTSARYTLSYALIRKKPTLLICLALPGNPFPVIDRELHGKPIRSGYQSHYVVVTDQGVPLSAEEHSQDNITLYDELIIDQQAQILPMFLIELRKNQGSRASIQFVNELTNPAAGTKSDPNLLLL